MNKIEQMNKFKLRNLVEKLHTVFERLSKGPGTSMSCMVDFGGYIGIKEIKVTKLDWFANPAMRTDLIKRLINQIEIGK